MARGRFANIEPVAGIDGIQARTYAMRLMDATAAFFLHGR